jgi:hypothetical protein
MENVICQIVFGYHQKHWNLSTLSTGILTIILTVSISNPKNVNKVVGPTVLLSARGTPSSWQMFRISKEVKADALVWQEFLESFNGECYLPDRIWISSETLELFTDSAGSASLGCGAQ